MNRTKGFKPFDWCFGDCIPAYIISGFISSQTVENGVERSRWNCFDEDEGCLVSSCQIWPFVLNPSSGKRIFKPSCSQNKLTFGFFPIVLKKHSPLMTMMQSYKLPSILAAQKCKICFAQTQRGGGYSGAACGVLTNTNTRGCKRRGIFSQRQDRSAGWRRI